MRAIPEEMGGEVESAKDTPHSRMEYVVTMENDGGIRMSQCVAEALPNGCPFRHACERGGRLEGAIPIPT
jgi:hypothetical protein